MFRRILIANRGEIALRIIRACREMNVEIVCVFSDEDRGAEYLALADRAILGAGWLLAGSDLERILPEASIS